MCQFWKTCVSFVKILNTSIICIINFLVDLNSTEFIAYLKKQNDVSSKSTWKKSYGNVNWKISSKCLSYDLDRKNYHMVGGKIRFSSRIDSNKITSLHSKLWHAHIWSLNICQCASGENEKIFALYQNCDPI